MSREDAARGDGTSVDSADVVTADSAALARSGPSRHTWQRKAVLDQLRQCDDFVSAQGLHRLLEVSGTSIGLSTVYRQLNSLAESGLADTIRLNERQMFRVCEDGGRHHHHLVCERCGKTFEIEPPDNEWFASVARRHGFTVTSHTMEVFGLCSECLADAQDGEVGAGRDTTRPSDI